MVVLIELKDQRFAMDEADFHCPLPVYVATSEQLLYPLERPKLAETLITF
jgi:hypothetical protein